MSAAFVVLFGLVLDLAVVLVVVRWSRRWRRRRAIVPRLAQLQNGLL
jgi:hypothetical protein